MGEQFKQLSLSKSDWRSIATLLGNAVDQTNGLARDRYERLYNCVAATASCQESNCASHAGELHLPKGWEMLQHTEWSDKRERRPDG